VTQSNRADHSADGTDDDHADDTENFFVKNIVSNFIDG
jgi:hypothetical protein